MSPRARVRSAVVAVGLAGAVLGACGGGSSPPAARHATTTTTTAPSTSTTAAGVTTTTAAATATTAAGGHGCGFSQLAVSSSSQGAAGHIGVVLVFKNTSTATCTLVGYPGVAGLDSAGQQVVQATRTPSGFMGGISGSTPPTVTLAPGASASALIESTDVPTGNETSCPTYASLLVTPPNTTQSVTIAQSLPGCSGLQVHPVVAGTSGGAG